MATLTAPVELLTSTTHLARTEVRGKFLYAGGKKLPVCGVTYGTFRPGPDGSDYPHARVLQRDFAAMAASGVNAIRTYTPPSREFLDQAQAHGLRVMVGLPWEQHVTFLETRAQARDIRKRIAAQARKLAGHPALLCLSIGNEIPASIVRWHGRRQIEEFLRELYLTAKDQDPDSLVTYVNFPTTEYLELPFLDLTCFNVYLERPETLAAYLAKLQTLSGGKPLLMGEVGLDSLRNGAVRQAEVLDWQIDTAFAAGCAGTFVFSWTDEWHRGGFDVEDWDFGLTTRERAPKLALTTVRQAFADPLRSASRPWPRVSVVVCTYNGSRTLAETLQHVCDLQYPNFEVIVVNDGSTDNCAEIAAGFPVRLISVENGGLSRARNLGAEAATGEIVAYIDDDAYPDPHWLHYLALEFLEHPNHAGVGGPNLPPVGDGRIAQAVANSPGGPLEVLVTDREAEHIPGCNCAFRRDRLLAIGGFDPTFRTAGDDVDFCWRLMDQGWTIGYHPSALVWHHRRNSVKTFLKQQRGYGIAEALLERKHPDRYNLLGHVTWKGRVYGKGVWQVLTWKKWRVYHGTWNAAPYQGLYAPRLGMVEEFVLAPEWYVVVATFFGLSLLGLEWAPLRIFWALFPLAMLIPLMHVFASVRAAAFPEAKGFWERLGLRALTALLFMVQPLARLRGRLRFGLTPLRKPDVRGWTFPISQMASCWSENWRAPEDWLMELESNARCRVSRVLRGGDFDTWDLELCVGMLGGVQVMMSIEEHGGGKELLRFRVRPRFAPQWVWVPVSTLTAIVALWSGAPITGTVFALLATAIGLTGLREAGQAMAAARQAVQGLAKTVPVK